MARRVGSSSSDHHQYLLIPNNRTPWNCGNLGSRTIRREMKLITKWLGLFLVYMQVIRNLEEGSQSQYNPELTIREKQGSITYTMIGTAVRNLRDDVNCLPSLICSHWVNLLLLSSDPSQIQCKKYSWARLCKILVMVQANGTETMGKDTIITCSAVKKSRYTIQTPLPSNQETSGLEHWARFVGHNMVWASKGSRTWALWSTVITGKS